MAVIKIDKQLAADAAPLTDTIGKLLDQNVPLAVGCYALLQNLAFQIYASNKEDATVREVLLRQCTELLEVTVKQSTNRPQLRRASCEGMTIGIDDPKELNKAIKSITAIAGDYRYEVAFVALVNVLAGTICASREQGYLNGDLMEQSTKLIKTVVDTCGDDPEPPRLEVVS